MNIDYNSLKVFLVLMQTGSTLAAAERLGRSQSYISKTISNLREQLGDPLFVSSNGGSDPTSYSLSIEPKLRAAFELLDSSLYSDTFEPSRLTKITMHIAEPYLVTVGRMIYETLREHTSAVIELRTWTNDSEMAIRDGMVDLGMHFKMDRPKSIYQKPLRNCAVRVQGDTNGESMSYVVDGVTDMLPTFKARERLSTPTVVVDNHELATQLMDKCFVPVLEQMDDGVTFGKSSTSVAFIAKSARRSEPKIEWLMSVLESVL